MRRPLILALTFASGFSALAQQLDPSLFEESADRQSKDWNWNKPVIPTRFGVEFSFGLNPYNWAPVEYEEADAIVRQTIERNRPNMSAQQLNNTLWDMHYNNVLNTFQNASGSYQGLSPTLLRFRYQPSTSLPLDVSIGFGKSVGLFYAKTALDETGATIGVNQTDLITTSFTDHYFHLREIYSNSFIEQPVVAQIWKPTFMEIGVGYSPTDALKFVGMLAMVPNATSSAQSWQLQSNENGVSTSINEITEVSTASQFALGVQYQTGALTMGIEHRWFQFFRDTNEYIQIGASSLNMPSYFSMSLGYRWS